MDILWVALGICVVVVFVFYVLAQHWQRLLARHAWTVRELTERLASLEEIANPDLLRKIEESASPPLEQVYTFRVCFSDRFWNETLGATPEEMAFVRSQGNVLASVKIERWRSHSVVTIAEILPQCKSASWQTRSLEIFPGSVPGEARFFTLWELPLGETDGGSVPAKSRSLELRLYDGSLTLCSCHNRLPAGEAEADSRTEDEKLLTIVPLDETRLARYRARDEATEADGFEAIPDPAEPTRREDSCVSFYGHLDERLGLDWHLCLRKLVRRDEGQRVEILESGEIRKVS